MGALRVWTTGAEETAGGARFGAGVLASRTLASVTDRPGERTTTEVEGTAAVAGGPTVADEAGGGAGGSLAFGCDAGGEDAAAGESATTVRPVEAGGSASRGGESTILGEVGSARSEPSATGAGGAEGTSAATGTGGDSSAGAWSSTELAASAGGATLDA